MSITLSIGAPSETGANPTKLEPETEDVLLAVTLNLELLLPLNE